MKGSSYTPSAVSSLVRSAEGYLSTGEFSQAMEQLSKAQQLQPGNQVVQTIMEKVRTLQEEEKRGTLQKGLPGGDPALQSGRFLSLTVGKNFEQGIKAQRDEPQTSPDEVRMRVRELTETAQILLNRGLRESAFDALMKAYLLDPLSPEVISCEERVLPRWIQQHSQEVALPVTAAGGMRKAIKQGPGGRRPTGTKKPPKGTSVGPAKKK